MNETKTRNRIERSRERRIRGRTPWKQWCIACASSGLCLSLAQAQGLPPAPPAVTAPPAVISPPVTAPSGVTVPDPSAPPPAGDLPPPPAEPVAPPPPPPPPPVILVAPAPPPAPPTVAIVTPAPAPSTPAWSPVFTGSYFTRYELRSGFDDLGVSGPARPRFLEGDAMFYRVRFGIGTGLFEVGPGLKVGLQFTPQTAGTFGNLGPNTIVDATLGLHEGYARVQGTYTRLDTGRFELNYGDSLILGNLDWNEVGRTFDGVRARIASSPSSAWLDLFATVVDEGRPDFLGVADGDIYFVGAYGALGPSIMKGLDLDVYAFLRAWGDAKGVRVVPANAMPTYRRENAAEFTLGARAKQKVGAFDYRFEAGLQAGSRPGTAPDAMAMAPVPDVENVDVVAGHADLELGLNVAEDKFRASLEGIYASGNDPSTADKNEGWDELFPTAHKFLGLTDAFAQNGIKRTNVASGVVHLTAVPVKNLTFQVDGHVFARLEPQVVMGQDGLAGGELDVGAVYVLAKGLKVRALYGAFFPSEDLYDDTLPATGYLTKNADPAHFAELELRYDLVP